MTAAERSQKPEEIRWKKLAEELPEPGRNINLELNSSGSIYIGQVFASGDDWAIYNIGGRSINRENSAGWEWAYIPGRNQA